MVCWPFFITRRFSNHSRSYMINSVIFGVQQLWATSSLVIQFSVGFPRRERRSGEGDGDFDFKTSTSFFVFGYNIEQLKYLKVAAARNATFSQSLPLPQTPLRSTKKSNKGGYSCPVWLFRLKIMPV